MTAGSVRAGPEAGYGRWCGLLALQPSEAISTRASPTSKLPVPSPKTPLESAPSPVQGFAHTPQKLDLICECGNASCASRIEMDREEYEQVRSDSTTFAIVKGHAIPDIEEIVERRKAYDVVRKTADEAEEIAEKTDPRT